MKMVCTVCQQDMICEGPQPAGHMTYGTDTDHSLPGHEDCGTLVIGFNFDRGIQGTAVQIPLLLSYAFHCECSKYTFITGPEHPNPGVPYWCLFCNAYLPDNAEGQELCSLLVRAFNRRLIFTIGVDNTVVPNGIELKTSKSGGPSRYANHF